MGRVEVATLGWGQLTIPGTNAPLADGVPQINTTVYANSVGGATIAPGDFKSNADGLLPGFVEADTYTFVEPDGQSRQVEAPSAAETKARLLAVESGGRTAVSQEAPLNVNWPEYDGDVELAAAAIGSPGGEIIVPERADPYECSAIPVKSKTAFRALGRGAVLKLPDGAPQLGIGPYPTHRAMFINVEADDAGDTDISFDGFTVDCNARGNLTTFTFGLQLYGIRKGGIRRCHFYDHRSLAVWIGLNNVGSLVQNEDYFVEGNTVEGLGNTESGWGAFASNGGDRLHFNDLSGKKAGNYMVDLEVDNTTTYFRNPQVRGISVEDLGGGVFAIGRAAGQIIDPIITDVTLRDGPGYALSYLVRVEYGIGGQIENIGSEYAVFANFVYLYETDSMDIAGINGRAGISGPANSAVKLEDSDNNTLSRLILPGGGNQTYAVEEVGSSDGNVIGPPHRLGGSTGKVKLLGGSSRAEGAGLRYATIASAATIAPPPGARVVTVTGTTGITSITAGSGRAGDRLTLIFAGALTVTDGSNLKLNGNFVTTADDVLELGCDGTNWHEIARSAN